MPQIADFLLAVIFAINILSCLTIVSFGNFSKIVTLLLVYICLVNLFWGILYEDDSIYFNIFYYLFNLFVFLLTTHFLKNVREYKMVVCFGILSSYIVQLCAIPFGRESGIRNIIFFNNPNQLGLWALVTIFILYIYYESKFLKGVYFFSALIISLYFITLSISKASIITIAIFLIYLSFRSVKQSFIPLTIIISLGVYFIENSNIEFQEIKLMANLLDRIENDNTSDDSFGGRGYDRIWNHPFHNILGAGEGANYRFKSEWYGEIHSALGTLLFCYGLFGFFSFIYLMFKIFTKNNLNIYIIMLLVNIYMTVHLGIRSAFLWMLFSHMYYFRDFLIKPANNSQYV